MKPEKVHVKGAHGPLIATQTSQYPISLDIPTKYWTLVHFKATSFWPSRRLREAMEHQYGACKRLCQMGTWTAAQAAMRGTVRPLGGYQIKPRYQELARRLGIEGTVLPNASRSAAGAAPPPTSDMATELERATLPPVRCSVLFGLDGYPAQPSQSDHMTLGHSNPIGPRPIRPRRARLCQSCVD